MKLLFLRENPSGTLPQHEVFPQEQNLKSEDKHTATHELTHKLHTPN